MDGTCLMSRYSKYLSCSFSHPFLFVIINFVLLQVLDLSRLSWSSLKLKVESTSDEPEESRLQEILPAIAGHTMVIRIESTRCIFVPHSAFG